MDLTTLQRQFLAALQQQDSSIYQHIKSDEKLSAEQRFAIYRNSIESNLIMILKDNYPVITQLVGDEYMNALAVRFVSANPSHDANLSNYGAEFADFLQNFPPVQQDLPYLADVARLEWTWLQAYFGEDASALDFDELAKQSPDADIQFYLCRNASLVQSSYPILKIWQMNQADAEQQAIDLSAGGDWLLVWRPELDTLITPLTETQFTLLSAIQSGSSVHQLAQQFAEHIDLAENLPILAQRGWLSHFNVIGSVS